MTNNDLSVLSSIIQKQMNFIIKNSKDDKYSFQDLLHDTLRQYLKYFTMTDDEMIEVQKLVIKSIPGIRI